MTCVVKFTHLKQTLFVHSRQLFYSLKRCLEPFLQRKERNITLWNNNWIVNLHTDLWNATQFGNLRTDLYLRDKKKVQMMNVLTSVVLSHFYIVSMLLSLKSILALFARRIANQKVFNQVVIESDFPFIQDNKREEEGDYSMGGGGGVGWLMFDKMVMREGASQSMDTFTRKYSH